MGLGMNFPPLTEKIFTSLEKKLSDEENIWGREFSDAHHFLFTEYATDVKEAISEAIKESLSEIYDKLVNFYYENV